MVDYPLHILASLVILAQIDLILQSYLTTGSSLEPWLLIMPLALNHAIASTLEHSFSNFFVVSHTMKFSSKHESGVLFSQSVS